MSTDHRSSGTSPEPVTDTSQAGQSAATDRRRSVPMPRRWAGWLVSSIPTAAVLVLLAAVGWWGHHSGWRMPTFSELTGETSPLPEDWCDEHAVPESLCVECNPDEYPQRRLYGWCKVHGIHECPFHHPDVAQLDPPPAVDPRDVARAERALRLKPRPENNFACQNPGRRIQFASRAAAEKAGVDIEPVLRSRIMESIRATGEIRYDETRIARLGSKAAGTVWRVEKQVGEQVTKGDLLALIDSAGVGLAKSQLQQALAEWQFNLATVERYRPLAESGAASQAKVLEAEIAVRTSWVRVRGAHQALVNLGLPLSLETVKNLPESDLAERLQFLGLPDGVATELDFATTTSSLLPVTASLSGVVVSRDVVAGEVVDTDKPLFTVADTSQMWLRLNVPLEESSYVEVGQPVTFSPDGSFEPVTGTIDWMSTSADQKTRTVAVRATLRNPDHRLLNETFGIGRIVLRDEPDAIVVPTEAVQWDGSCSVVFVRDQAWFEEKSPKLFHTRSVRVGTRTDDVTEIIAGLLPGEVVATVGSDVLRAQLLKNNLGAG